MTRRQMVRWSLVGIVAIVILLIAAWLYLKFSDAFPIEHVKVNGTFRALSTQKMQALLMPELEHGMLNIEGSAIDAALKHFPSVESVKITRDWPATVTVRVMAYPLLAQFPNGEVLTTGGKLFHPVLSETLHDIPLFIMSMHHLSQAVKRYQQDAKILQMAHLWITGVEATHSGVWQLKVNPGFWIYAGSEDIRDRLKRFVQAYPKLIKSHPNQQLDYVDLRYHTGFAVRWR